MFIHILQRKQLKEEFDDNAARIVNRKVKCESIHLFMGIACNVIIKYWERNWIAGRRKKNCTMLRRKNEEKLKHTGQNWKYLTFCTKNYVDLSIHVNTEYLHRNLHIDLIELRSVVVFCCFFFLQYWDCMPFGLFFFLLRKRYLQCAIRI